MTFSQRHGINAVIKPLQIETIDLELLNGLWNIYRLGILDIINECEYNNNSSRKRAFFIRIYHSYFKKDIDTVPYDFNQAVGIIKKFFFKESM